MKRTMMYSVGGQTFNVAADEDQMFNEAAKASGVKVSPMRRFRVGGQTIDIDDADVNVFSAAAKQSGFAPEEVRTMQMADGSQREFTNKEMAKYLRSPEYRGSADYVKPEQGSVTWAGIKGALTGAVEGAVEGGKAGLAKAAWALPQVGTGVLRAGGNLVNALGNAPNAVGNAMVRGANAADAKMEEIMPTSTSDRLGYEDWGTKTGDFFGNVAGMAVKFAPAGGASLASKVFTEAMLASDGINAYENTLRTAEENGMGLAEANALGAASGLVNYFGGKALLKAGGVSKNIKNPLLREATAAATSGAVMGAQGGANKSIENAATGKPIGEGVAGAAAEGFAEGAAFHGANMIPRLPSLVKQTKEHYTAARTWIMDAAKDDPAMLSDLMDQPALDDVIKARRGGKDVSRKMGDDIFLPNNMSGEQRNAVVDAIIAYRDGVKAQGELAKANMDTAQSEKERIGTQNYKDAVGRKEAEQNAQIRRDAMNGVEEPIEGDVPTEGRIEAERSAMGGSEVENKEPSFLGVKHRASGKPSMMRGENAELLQQSADQYAKDDPAGAKAYGEWLKRNGKKDSIANRRDWFENDYTKAGEHPLTERATENEIPDITREEYDKAIADWTAKKEAAQKQGKTLDEPKPYAQFEDYDALLAAQKTNMDAADKAAADAAHVERGEDIAQAFADWKEDAVKAKKQGKVAPKASAEVEDVRAKAEADAVVQRLNAEWQKAKTPAERNAIKGQLVDRLKELGIGAKDKAAEAQQSKTDTAQSKTDDEVAKSENKLRDGILSERTSKGVKPKRANKKEWPENGAEFSAGKTVIARGTQAQSQTITMLSEDHPEMTVRQIRELFNDSPEKSGGMTKLFSGRRALLDGGESKILDAYIVSGLGDVRASALFAERRGFKAKDDPNGGWTATNDKVRAYEEKLYGVQSAPKTQSSASAPNVKQPTPPTAAKSAETVKQVKSSEPVVENVGGDVAIDAPESVESKISSMPYGKERRQAQFDYMDAEVKKAKEAIKDIKFSEDGRVRTVGANIPETVTIKVPADGEFTMKNTPDGIAKLEQICAKLKAQVKDRVKEIPSGSRPATMPFTGKDGKTTIENIRETIWKAEKPESLPKSPSVTIAKAGKSITEADAKKLAQPFASKDKKRAQLNKVKVDDGAVVATDGRRIVVIDVPGAKNDGSEYPDWTSVIPKNTAHEAKFSTEELYTKLTQAKVIADGTEGYPTVEIYELKDGTLGVRSKVEGIGEYNTHESIPKDARNIGMFNVDFMLDMVNAAAKMGEKEIRIGYDNGHSPIIQRGNGYKQVIMPLRLNDIAPADRLESLRSDDAVKSWAKSNGREVVDGKVSPGAVNEYLKVQVGKAVNATKRLFSDAKVEVVDRDWNAEIDGEANTLRAKDGRIVGTFDPATKEIKLYRGADEKTVYHELIGHGVEDWAARNNKPLHDKLTELARTAPKEIVDDVRSRYAGADEATIAKEIIARIAEGKGAENIKLKDAPKTWYAKAYTTVRDAIIGFIEKLGGNRIDLDKLNDMTPEEGMEYLMREIGKGKTLGKLGAADAEGAMGAGEKWANKFWNRHASLEKIDKKSADEKALQPGREAEFQVRKFNVKKDEFKELLRKGDISVNEVDEYMKAVAAEERNAADGFASSGMSDAQIKATREFFAKHPNIKEIERAADYLWKMQEEGMRERIRSGLVSESEYSEWNAREKHHVPFRSAIDENGEWVNQYGRGVSGPEFVQHEGRYSESGSPSTWMFEEYANAHLRAIENDTRKVLADAVRNNAALGSIETNPALKESKINGDGGDRNVVSFKTVGKDGKSVTHHIVLKGERGAAAASSYTNRNLANKSPLLRKTQAFMRFWASTATEWSPTFALRNTFADNVDAAMVVLAEKGFKEGGKWLKSYAKNRAAVSKEVWKFARTGKVEDGSLLAKYMKEGGLIGGFQREGYGEIVKDFSADTIKKEFANGGNRAKAVANGVFGLVKAVNSYAELMTRVAAFKTNIEQDMSAKDAALWSRRISVDFNQKGDITPITNTLFMFSNSTIGATMRQLQAANTALKTPQGRKALLGLAAFGMAEALLEHAMNADEDKERAKRGEATGADVNEHTRKTSLYVRVGGNVFRAPTHEDPLMKLVYVANATTRLLLGDMKAKDYTFEVGGGALEDVPRFFGQGSKTLEAGWNTWLPTALQPIMQGVENKDYAGRPIYRPKYNEALPDSSNGRKSTQSEYKWMAETLNELTGGNKGRKGALDFAPETLKLIGESLGKNLGKDLGNAADVGLNILTGNFGELDSRRTPIVRDVMRKTEGNDNRYFAAMRKFDADKLDLATRDKARNWDEGERKAYYEAHPWLRKNGGKSTKIERIVNGYTQNGVHISGINDLRRMEGGERRVMTAQGMKWRSYDWSQEKLAEFKKMRLEKQAKVLELMGE